MTVLLRLGREGSLCYNIPVEMGCLQPPCCHFPLTQAPLKNSWPLLEPHRVSWGMVPLPDPRGSIMLSSHDLIIEVFTADSFLEGKPLFRWGLSSSFGVNNEWVPHLSPISQYLKCQRIRFSLGHYNEPSLFWWLNDPWKLEQWKDPEHISRSLFCRISKNFLWSSHLLIFSSSHFFIHSGMPTCSLKEVL